MKPIEIIDKNLFNQYLTGHLLNSEYQFSTLFMWQPTYEFEYEEWGDCLLIYGKQSNGDVQVYYPIGPEEKTIDAFDHIKKVFAEKKQPLNFRPLSEDMKDHLLSVLGMDLTVGTKEAYYDYIYDYNSLKGFQGSKYKRKRHELNQFCSRNNYCYETITKENKQEAFIAVSRIMNTDNNYDINEHEAYRRLFDNYELLGVRGGCLRIDGVIEAVAVGDPVNDYMVMMLMRRCNKSFVGIYPAMLHYVLINEFRDKEYQIVNFQDDTGNERIRNAKLSYHPIYRLKKYYVKE